MQPRALIFDCDGPLADSMPLHWRAWNSVCQRNGIELSEARFYKLGGVPSQKILAMLKQEQVLDFDPAEISRQKEEAYLPLMAEVKLIEPIAAIARAPVACARAQALAHPRPGGATLFGLPATTQVDAEWAAWANGTAVRELDFHDTFLMA